MCCCFGSTRPLQKKNILNCKIISKLNSYRETPADRMCPVTEGVPFSPTGCQCVVQGVSGWYWVSVCGAGCKWVVQGVSGWYWVSVCGAGV